MSVQRIADRIPRKRRTLVRVGDGEVAVDRGIRAIFTALISVPGVEIYSSSAGEHGSFAPEESAYVELGGNLEILTEIAAGIASMHYSRTVVHTGPVRLEVMPRGVFLRWRPSAYRDVLRMVKDVVRGFTVASAA